MDLAYNNLYRRHHLKYKLSFVQVLRAIVQNKKSFEFSLSSFFSAESLISRFIQKHRRFQKSQADQRHTRVDAITFFLTYEYHKSFRHSFAQRQKKENGKNRKPDKKKLKFLSQYQQIEFGNNYQQRYKSLKIKHFLFKCEFPIFRLI